ncbi:Similar to Scrt1: Transcriptional repressor scratch 1 (Mus musculus) [Cotesia congregata]|uniref:Similar to Scrt1: Transcriptional repressor scratch 1 (Mus musculus) n=1 Tax=Cotesia congregata TaxID=51543 RepID=A0A8J2H759_COTCN|nr:Similar to Scrt1: Transcriptional repressor scratch 1 (Mus musculus) [Cotesia congregata]
MPRAFLITHRRYNGTEGFEDVGREVSLAAAAGTLIHPNNVIYHRSLSPRWTPGVENLHVYRSSPPESLHHINFHHNLNHRSENELSLHERTRLFFERIETEREILQDKTKARLSHLDESKNLSLPINQSLSPINLPARRISSGQSDTSKTDDNEDHECPDCGKKYSTSSNLARHRQTHRSLGDKKARRCPHCDKVYVSMPAFSMHVRTHNQGCKLPRPGFALEPMSTIIRHTKSQSAVSPPTPSAIQEENPAKIGASDSEYLSRMVIRTSVISQNPEHVPGRNKNVPFDFSDPTRPSAFSRPGITLNLAIA